MRLTACRVAFLRSALPFRHMAFDAAPCAASAARWFYSMNINYYVLTDTYTQAMQIQQMMREANIPSRVSPVPHAIQGIAGCGVSVLLTADVKEQAENYLIEHGAAYHSIVPLECQIDPTRDKFV